MTSSTPDKVAVVTGASSGIGAATARALAADGYRVALLARRLDRITALADERGNGSTAIEADVTDRDSIVAAADRVRQELGTAGALVNNAGVMLLGPFGSGQRADYRQMIEVNLLGAITATELPDHITHPDTKQGVQQLYDKAEVTDADVAEIIAFILSRPRRLAINEILLRPAGQQ